MEIQRIRAAGVTVRPTRCEVSHAVVDLLGQTIGKGKLRQQDRKIEVLKVEFLKSKKDLRSLLGLVGYHQKCIKDYAFLTMPLTNSTR